MIKRSHVRNRFSWCAATSASLAVFSWVAAAPGLTAAAAFVVAGLGLSAPVAAQEQPPAKPHIDLQAHPECTVNLANVVTMKDIMSNALTRGLKVPRRDVALFLDGAQHRYKTLPELLKAAAVQFKMTEDVLTAKVEKYKHCNCNHPMESALHPHIRVDPQPHPECTVNLELAGNMSDILSNALLLDLKIPEPDVRAVLADADKQYEDGPEVFKTTAVHFKLSEEVLAAEVQKFRHCNCKHPGGGEAAAGVGGQQRDDELSMSEFAKDVTLHVVLHELGHALIREFDIPILGNEETVADAFATYYLTTHLPERAVDVLTARTTSLMIEAGETPEVDWRGEHDDDARRAYQIAAIAVAADPVKYKPVADIVGMSEEEIKKASDYGAEIRRSWRRVLGPLWMPEGASSAKARVICDDGNALLIRLCEDGLSSEIETAAKRFDWHSQVTVRFVNGDGRAGWNRSARTVTVHSAYVRRFIGQGARGLPGSK
jgi:hypothetical protein